MAEVESVQTLTVLRRRELTSNVVLLELVDPSGAPLPAWQPGAHIDLELPGDLVRQYSLCGDPADRGSYQIAVLREDGGRGGSAYVHSSVHEGTQVVTRGPRNHFRFHPAGRVVFIAGGIGITPLMPMLRDAESAGLDWTLFYGGRSRSSMAFADELLSVHGPDRVTLVPQDEQGLLDLATILSTHAGTSVFCCGPGPLLDAVEAACATWPVGTLHTERFTPKVVGEPALADAFEVELTQSGLTVTVPLGTAIIDAVEAAGVDVVSSCREGTCGSCETVVLEGTPDHRDSVLTDAERATNDLMMICVSRSRTPRLVLEL